MRPRINSPSLADQKPTSQTTTSLRLALETAVLITILPMGVSELVNLSGTSLFTVPLSATLSTTVSHSLPWDPWTVITQSAYLRPTLDLRSLHCAVYGERTHTSEGSGEEAFSSLAIASASALFSRVSRSPHTTSMHSIDMSVPEDPVIPFW